jgi:BlaI family penicillinase repressor
MSRQPRISDAEWQVMEVLWNRSPLAAGDVVDALVDSGWSPQTIKTMLNRLTKKGALSFQTEGKRYLYRPKVGRTSCVRSETRSFLKRIFGGEVGPMLAHFVDHEKLTPEQIRELKQLLDKKER